MKKILFVMSCLLICPIAIANPNCPDRISCRIGFIDIGEIIGQCAYDPCNPDEPNFARCWELMDEAGWHWLSDECYERAPNGGCEFCWDSGMTPSRIEITLDGILPCLFHPIEPPNGRSFYLYQEEGDHQCYWATTHAPDTLGFIVQAGLDYGGWVSCHYRYRLKTGEIDSVLFFYGETSEECPTVINAIYCGCNIAGYGGGFGGYASAFACKYRKENL